MTTTQSPIAQCAANLSIRGELKVWSVIVSLLGDLLHSGQNRMQGTVLTEILAHLGITPESIRVAVHRLKRDGWIISEKNGRQADYLFTSVGAVQTQSYFDVVYGGLPDAIQSATLAVLPPDIGTLSSDIPDNAIILGPRTVVVPTQTDWDCDPLVTQIEIITMPNWVQLMLRDRAKIDEFSQFCELVKNLSAIQTSDPVEIMAVRLMALHSWRRIVLRYDRFAYAMIGVRNFDDDPFDLFQSMMGQFPIQNG